MSNFRKVEAKDIEYRKIADQHRQELEKFMDFSKSKSKTDTSGKANSYRGYIIRMLVHLKEILNVEIMQLSTPETVKELEKLERIQGYKEVNRDSGNHYSASLSEFKKYVRDIFKEDNFSVSIYDLKSLISGGVTQLVLTGAPGTGKTYMATRLANDLSDQFAKLTWKENESNYELVQFHPSFDYTDFIEGLRPVEIDNKMVFKRVDGQFKRFCRNVIEHGEVDKNYLFIIDEINRADLSKVFGELMYSLETDKRGSNHRIATQYDNLPTYDLVNEETLKDDVFKEGFFIPENVIIIGTMNDIDRSVESMDFALRRRFHWYEVKVTELLLEDAFSSQNDSGYNYFAFIEDEAVHQEVRQLIIRQVMKMNREVIGAEKYHLNDAYYISQGYFKHLPENWSKNGYLQEDDSKDILKKILNHVWEYSLDSLLTEYVRGETYAEEFLNECRSRFMNLVELEKTNTSGSVVNSNGGDESSEPQDNREIGTSTEEERDYDE